MDQKQVYQYIVKMKEMVPSLNEMQEEQDRLVNSMLSCIQEEVETGEGAKTLTLSHIKTLYITLCKMLIHIFILI